MPFKLLHRTTASITSHTSNKSRDRYSSQKKCSGDPEEAAGANNHIDLKSAQIVKALATTSYKEYFDEEEGTAGAGVNAGAAHADHLTKAKPAARREPVDEDQRSKKDDKEELEGNERSKGIRELKALVGGYERADDGDELQNSFQKRIDQCEAYFRSHLANFREDAAVHKEADGKADDLMPGMASKQQEQFLMKDSLSPSYAARAQGDGKVAKVRESEDGQIFDSV